MTTPITDRGLAVGASSGRYHYIHVRECGYAWHLPHPADTAHRITS
ncbi:hypothetical protein [Lentzea sp. E54]